MWLHYPSMTDDKTELRAALRLAMTAIRKIKAHQNVNTTELLRLLGRTLQQTKPEGEVPRKVGSGRVGCDRIPFPENGTVLVAAAYPPPADTVIAHSFPTAP
jgi:hypothetical protein